MKLGLMLPPKPDIKWTLAAQAGITRAVTKAAPELSRALPPWDFGALQKIHAQFTENGMRLHALEGDQFDMNRIKMGLPGRDEDIEKYHRMLENMGRLEIPVLCYNFMAGIGWFRTRVDLPERGGALTSGFDLNDVEAEPLKISEEQLWKNYGYFIRAVMPVAEKSGVKMGLHPDDPPVSPLKGYGRILTSADAYRRAMALSDSPSHCITFCLATFKTMGENVLALLPEFAKRIVFLHFRDIEGSKTKFRETFHDNGPTDMVAVLKRCHEIGLDVLSRPDHTPTMAGETNANPGYEMQGSLLAIGYLKGLMEALGIHY